jgi:HD-GYP domain-containing protein (c-di-GMP phosphodiesterase class II)
MKLFKTLLLLMGVASIVPTVMVGWLSSSDTRELLVRDAQELAQARVEQIRLRVLHLVEEPARAAQGIAQIPGFFQLPSTEQRSLIGATLNQRTELVALTFFDKEQQRVPGLQAFAVKDMKPSEVAEHEARAQALLPAESLVYSDVFWKEEGAAVTVAFPVGDPVQGYAAADIALDAASAMLARQRMGSTGTVYIVDSKGRLIAGTVAGAKPGANLATRAPVVELQKTWSKESGMETFRVGHFGEGDDRVVSAFTTVPALQWAVVSEQPLAQAYLQVSSMERRNLWFIIAAVLVALGLAAVFSRNVTSPLKDFMKVALEIAQGNFGAQVKIKAKNEIGELAQTMNYMSMQIDAYGQETRRLYESLEKGYLETILALANSIDSKDAYTRGHSQRVGDMSVEIGRELGMNQQQLKWLQYGGYLHDIGKIGIIDDILCKQSRLTDDEMAVMRQHPEIGDAIIAPVSFLSPCRPAVRSHHERWDGKGYPDNLKAEQIPLIARIVNCADTFDACTSTRPYQKAMTVERTMDILEGLRGTQIDPVVLDAFRRALVKKGLLTEATPSSTTAPVKLAS